ncbi:MAG: aldo/keto reductase [Dehalococcoidia bacterium]
MPEAGLPTRTLGRTGMQVTQLGYGALEFRMVRPSYRRIPPEQAGAVLHAVLDAGINFIDTSPDYGASEEVVGQWLRHRRSEFFLASKCGCPVAVDPLAAPPREHTYTRENIVANVEQSLRRLRTDYLDLVQFHHTPSRQELEQGDALRALEDLRTAGKVRFIGASSSVPRLPELIDAGIFDAFQIPYSALQREHEPWITRAAEAGAGTIIRGGAARGAASEEKDWSVPVIGVEEDRPRSLWERAGLDDLLDGMGRHEFILRFTLSHPDLHTTIVGTARPDHLQANLDAARKGPLPADLYAETKRRLNAAETNGS